MFHVTELDTGWLYLPASKWPEKDNEHYTTFYNIIRSMTVVNDCTEFSIKDVTDYVKSDYARDGDQHTIIVTQDHHQLYDSKHLTKVQLDNLDDYF